MEFPGGKIEEGEELEDTLKREILEELDIEILVGERITTVEYDYPSFHISMDCYLCEVAAGSLVLKEHEAAKWFTKDSIMTVDWLPADIEIVQKLLKL